MSLKTLALTLTRPLPPKSQLQLHQLSRRFIIFRDNIKKASDWKWSYPKRKELKSLKAERSKINQQVQNAMILPSYFTGKKMNKMEVIFIRNMDEFVAGQICTVSNGLYRQWLYPNKIALPANEVNINKYQHLNHRVRQEMQLKREIAVLNEEISRFVLDCKIRRDPDTREIYSFIHKKKICRQLLLYKRLEIPDPNENIQIQRIDEDNERIDVESIAEEGAYNIILTMMNDNQFAFRMNVKCVDLPMHENIPHFERNEKHKKLSWMRAKHANEFLDETITDRQGRYSDLYQIGKNTTTQ